MNNTSSRSSRSTSPHMGAYLENTTGHSLVRGGYLACPGCHGAIHLDDRHFAQGTERGICLSSHLDTTRLAMGKLCGCLA